MTGPFAFLDDPNRNQTDTVPQRESPFSFLDKPKEEQGVFSYLGNLAKNSIAITSAGAQPNSALAALGNLMFGNSPQDRQQLQQIRQNLVDARQTEGETWNRVKEDLSPSKFFSKISELAPSGSAGDIVSSLPMALAQTAGAPLSAVTGLGMGESGAPILTPEERASQVKQTAGIVLSSAVAGVTRLALTSAFEKAALGGVSAKVAGAVLGQETETGLNLLRKGPAIGQFARSLIKGGVEASAAGVTFGAVANANTENQLGGILQGLMFAPIGMVAEVIGAKVHGGDAISDIQQKAGQLFAMRQLGYAPDKSLNELMTNVQSMATADNLALAVGRSQIDLGNSHIMIPNVSKQTLETLSKEHLGLQQGRFAFERVNENGSRDALFIAGDIFGYDVATWKKTGYLPNEVVSYKGTDYLFKQNWAAGDGTDMAKLTHPVNGKVIEAPYSDISRNTAFDLDKGTVLIDSPVTLKGKLIAAFRNSSRSDIYPLPNPFHDENTNALNSVKTGSPITFIGMRQDRGQGIIGNGKFYALEPDHLTGYTDRTAAGRESALGILDNNLRVNRLSFENPFVFNGKHYSLMKDVERFYNKYITKGKGILGPFSADEIANSTSDAGMQWRKIFTPQEMKGIIEAKNFSNKPIGSPTNQYLGTAQKGPKTAELQKTVTNAKAIFEANKTTDNYDAFVNATVDLQEHLMNYTSVGVAGKTHLESHYAIVDRIVARAMRRNGHDGFIYNDGGIHGTEVVDIKERGVFNRKDQTTPVEGRASNVLDAQKFTDALYNDFKKNTEFDAPDYDKIAQSGPANQTRDIPFDEAFNNFVKEKGILPEEEGSLRRNFEQRIHGEILDALPDNEKPIFKRLQQEIADKRDLEFQNGSDKLRNSALHNNMYFDQADAGVIHLRDMESNKSLGVFHSIQDAQEFISKSGQGIGTNLDGNATIPPSAGAPSNIPDNVGPLNPPPSGWLEKKYALWTTRLSFATANPTLFKNWDTLFHSNLHSKVFNIIDTAAKLADGKKSVWLKQLKAADDVLGKATQADREHVFNWMETRSIAEHEQKGGIGGKSLSPIEMALGKQITNADLTNMYRYKNAMRSVAPNGADFAPMDKAMRQQFNIGPNEDNALTLLGIAEKNQIQKVSVGSAVHYARLLQNPELALTRAEYAKKFNLKPNQLQTGIALENYFNGLADVAGISKDKVLFNYITHARLYENGSLPDAIAKYALDKPTEEFYAALNRTGELSTIERDPIRAALRYTNALFDTLYLNPAINEAKANLKVELARLPEGSGLKVERDANRYMRDVRHMPAEGDRYADAAVNHMLNNTGINVEKGIARKWVNGINEVFTVAAQGARPWAGIRDFYSNTTKHYVKWGASDTSEMLRLGATADLDKLRQSGLIENYSQLGLNNAVDDAASALSNVKGSLKATIDKTTHKAMQLSGQQYVNDMARAGAFLHARNKVAGMLRDLHGGKFGDLTKPETYSKAYNSINLEQYSPAVFQEFDRMIKLNKTDEAANYLGNQHIQETFGNYANANHPSGWNNNFGRLVGKFGQWSINHRDYVVSLASRGTRAQKLQAIGRLAITESAVAGAATLLGVNLSNFYSVPGMYFKGGPAGDLFYTGYNALFGKGMEQQAAVRKVLQLLPYDQVNDKMKGSIVVPFSFALTDLVEGMEMASNGDVVGGLARLGGIRPQSNQYQPSKWEETIGNIVGGK